MLSNSEKCLSLYNACTAYRAAANEWEITRFIDFVAAWSKPEIRKSCVLLISTRHNGLQFCGGLCSFHCWFCSLVGALLMSEVGARLPRRALFQALHKSTPFHPYHAVSIAFCTTHFRNWMSGHPHKRKFGIRCTNPLELRTHRYCRWIALITGTFNSMLDVENYSDWSDRCNCSCIASDCVTRRWEDQQWLASVDAIGAIEFFGTRHAVNVKWSIECTDVPCIR